MVKPLASDNLNGVEQLKIETRCQTDERKAIIGGSSPSHRYYWRNLAGVSLGVLCLLSSYSILFFIQSSLHSKDGLGTMALAVDYASQVITCFFLPPFLMRTIGCKWSLVVSGICIAVFIVANLYATFATLIPASVFLGIGFATMWATMNTVVGDLSVGYAKLTKMSETATLSRFFSIFFCIITTAAIWANLISAQILSPQLMSSDGNETKTHQVCGAQYCDIVQQKSDNSSVNKTNSGEVRHSEVVNLVAAGLGSVGLGIVFILVLLSSYNPKGPETTDSTLTRLAGTVRLLRDPNLLLLIVLTINTGLMFSFLTADFTKAFVTCSIGIHKVGLVMTCYGVTVSGGTFVLGYLAPFLPRVSLFLGAVVLNVADLIIMLTWTPDPQDPAMFYVIAGVWGVTFAVWMSQVVALYGDVFAGNHQEAYSNHRIWDCVGFVIGFAWSHYLCMHTKIYIILGFLVIGTAGYLIVERRVVKRRIQ